MLPAGSPGSPRTRLHLLPAVVPDVGHVVLLHADGRGGELQDPEGAIAGPHDDLGHRGRPRAQPRGVGNWGGRRGDVRWRAREQSNVTSLRVNALGLAEVSGTFRECAVYLSIAVLLAIIVWTLKGCGQKHAAYLVSSALPR